MAVRNRRMTYNEINESLMSSGVNVTSRTVRNRPLAGGLRARVPRKKPYLNAKQRQKRLQWAKAHLKWKKEDWEKVIWRRDAHLHIWKRRDQVCATKSRGRITSRVYSTYNEASRQHHGMGCMSRTRVGRLQVLEGNVNADKYIRNVLEAKLWASARDLFGASGSYVFQQDGAPCHTAIKCLQWFQSHGVKLLQWPGNSPDLNPIENLWARLKRLVAKKHPSNKQDLTAAVISSWFHVIVSDELQNLGDSMPRRCQAVIDSKGYLTRYWTLSTVSHWRFSRTVLKSLCDLFLTENVQSISIILSVIIKQDNINDIVNC